MTGSRPVRNRHRVAGVSYVAQWRKAATLSHTGTGFGRGLFPAHVLARGSGVSRHRV